MPGGVGGGAGDDPAYPIRKLFGSYSENWPKNALF
jgi:hypothetical protein